MSWKNHVPSREHDFQIRKEYALLGESSVSLYIEVKCWVKEKITMVEQGSLIAKGGSISVSNELVCPYRIDLREWQSHIVDHILLGDDNEQN